MATSLRFLCNRFFRFCVLVFPFYSYKSCVFGARELASHQQANPKVSLLAASPCYTSTKGLQVANKYGPCSSVNQETPSPALRDQSRVRSLSDTSSPGINILQEDETENFVVKVGFGAPTQLFKLLFDTGSRYTWVRCQSPCSCQSQAESIFDPSTSSTFSATCLPLCNKNVTYNDNSNIIITYVQDTISFYSFDLYRMVFGCSYNNNVKGFPHVDGILGLGPGENSLMSQTNDTFKMFCYCLPSLEKTGGYLIFGEQARQTCNNPETTISLRPDEFRYSVNFVGITIDGKRLGMANSSSLSGTIFDSATVISRLPEPVYAELKSSFQELMPRFYPNANQSSQDGILDTCYDVGGFDASGIKGPLMILHFDDYNDLHLGISQVVSVSGSKVCLAFAAIVNEDPHSQTIIGNHQQRDVKIYYDVPSGQIGFRGGGCMQANLD